MADDSISKFHGISHAGKAGVGLFKLTSDQFGWKGEDGSTVQFASKDIAAAEWQNACGRKWLLKFCLKDAEVTKFAGFEKKDLEPLKAHLSKHFHLQLAVVDVATLGWSWGDLNLEGDTELRIMIDGKLGLEVPIAKLGQVTAQGKADLILELQDSIAGPADEVLHEIRFQVMPEKMSAETLQQELQQKAGLSERGEALGRVSEVMLVAPRGKHDLEFFRQSMKVHGKTQTYTVKYKSIARLFLMNLPGERDVAIVIGLDQPLRSGQQLNHFLVFMVAKDATMVPNLPADKMKEYNMAADAQQPVYVIISRLIKELSGKTMVAPASDLKTKNNCHCLRCSHKAAAGFLFPMKKSMIFITKPVLWIRYDDIDFIEFVKGMSRARSFDILVHFKDRPPVEFLQMESEDGDELIRFLKSVNVRLEGAELFLDRRKGPQSVSEVVALQQRRREALAAALPAKEGADGDDDEEDDEDFDEEGASSSEGDVDNDDDDDVDSDEEKPRKKRTKTK